MEDRAYFSDDMGIGNTMEAVMRIWIFILIILAWVLLQVYILPKLGIST